MSRKSVRNYRIIYSQSNNVSDLENIMKYSFLIFIKKRKKGGQEIKMDTNA